MQNKPSSDGPAVGAASETNGAPRPRPKQRGPGITPGTREANKLALAILDVLAGARLPAEAAEAVGLSLPRYYQLEQRALEAIVQACEPRPKGPPRNPERQAAQFQRQIGRLTQELSRQQALLRAAQRTIGLAPPPARPATSKPTGGSTGQTPGAKQKRKRKPTVRALKASRNLRQALDAQDAEAAASPTPAPSDISFPPTVIPEGGLP